MPPNLIKQQAELKIHLENYKDNYPMDKFEQEKDV